jgi:hypothetical protein
LTQAGENRWDPCVAYTGYLRRAVEDSCSLSAIDNDAVRMPQFLFDERSGAFDLERRC